MAMSESPNVTMSATPPLGRGTDGPANVRFSNGTDHEEHIDSSELIQTPLHNLIETAKNDTTGLADLEENLKKWKHLINARAPNEFRESPLHMLARRGFNQMARCLIDHDADIHAQDSEKAQPLHLACEGGNVSLITFLAGKAQVDHLDSDGYLPLHWASRYGRDTVISQLLGPGNNFLNQKESRWGQTPLNMACYHNKGKVVRELLSQDLDANLLLTDDDGWTPLFTAIVKGNYDILQTLVGHPQTLKKELYDIADNEGTTPLMQLCANASGKVAEYHRVTKAIGDFLKLPTDVNAKDKKGRTALHFAIESAIATKRTAAALAIMGCVSNDLLLARDNDGHTAFDIVSDNGVPSKVRQSVLNTLIRRLNPLDTDIEDLNQDLLYWMIEDVQRHSMAKHMLSQFPASKEVPERVASNSASWDLMEWVTYYRLPGALFQYIMVCPKPEYFDETTLQSHANRCKTLLGSLKEPSQEEPAQRKPAQKRPTQTRPARNLRPRGADKGKERNLTTQQYDEKAEVDGNRDILDMKEILGLCFIRLPPKRVETLSLLQANDEMSNALSKVEATVFQSYEFFGICSQVYRSRHLKEIVYESGTIETYTETVDRIQSKLYKPKDLPKIEAAEAKFTWIHLPFTNV